jgi:hypothetical protein
MGGGDGDDTLSDRENEERLPRRGSSGVLAPRSDSFFFRIWTGEPDVDVLRPLIARRGQPRKPHFRSCRLEFEAWRRALHGHASCASV